MAEPFPAGSRQPDQRSCGAACLVVAHALADRGYRELVSDPAAFRAESLAMHGRATSSIDVAGRIQPPWPRALGTPPWAVARQLTGTTDVPHRVAPVRWRDGGATYDGLHALPRPAAVYVGNGWLPRHVVLVLGTTPDGLRVYEPSSGRVVPVDRERFAGHRLALAGWDVPWFTVTPDR